MSTFKIGCNEHRSCMQSSMDWILTSSVCAMKSVADLFTVHWFRLTAGQMQTIRCCWSLEEQYPSLCLSNGISASLSILHSTLSVSLGEWTHRRKSSASKYLVVVYWRCESGESDVREQSSDLHRLSSSSCFRPLDLARKSQMSPSTIDILFSWSGRL